MASMNFDKLMEELEALKKATNDGEDILGLGSPKAKSLALEPTEGKLSDFFSQIQNEVNKPSVGNYNLGQDGSAAKKIVSNPELANAVSGENMAASVFMKPGATNEDWLINLYPDDAHVLHFQAKTAGTEGAYLRWYEPTTPEQWDAVSLVYQAATSVQLRKSFYPKSGKQYLICFRAGEFDIDIPGYGTVSVPKLFMK